MTTYAESGHLLCGICFPDKPCTWLGDTSDVRKPRDYEGLLWPWLIRVAATLLAVLLLAACGSDAPSSGLVTDRDYTAAYCYWYSIQSGKVSVPVYQCVPDDWELKIKSESQEGWLDVSQAVYDAHPVGSYVEPGTLPSDQ